MSLDSNPVMVLCPQCDTSPIFVYHKKRNAAAVWCDACDKTESKVEVLVCGGDDPLAAAQTAWNTVMPTMRESTGPFVSKPQTVTLKEKTQ